MRGSGMDDARSVDVMAPALRRFWARASAQACVDERFRAALIADPVGVLRGEGADIPPGARLTIDGAPLAAPSPAQTGPVPVVQAAGVATASGSAGAMPSWGWGWGGGPCFAAGQAPQCAAAPPAGAAGSAGAASHWSGGCWGAACSSAAPVAPGSQGAVPPCACTFAWALTGGEAQQSGSAPLGGGMGGGSGWSGGSTQGSGSAGASSPWSYAPWGVVASAGSAAGCSGLPPCESAGFAGAASQSSGGCCGAACSAAAPVAPGSQGAVPPCACTFAWGFTGSRAPDSGSAPVGGGSGGSARPWERPCEAPPVAPSSFEGAVPPCACTFAWAFTGSRAPDSGSAPVGGGMGGGSPGPCAATPPCVAPTISSGSFGAGPIPPMWGVCGGWGWSSGAAPRTHPPNWGEVPVTACGSQGAPPSWGGSCGWNACMCFAGGAPATGEAAPPAGDAAPPLAGAGPDSAATSSGEDGDSDPNPPAGWQADPG